MLRLHRALAVLLTACGAATPAAATTTPAPPVDDAAESPTPTPPRPLFAWTVTSPGGAESTLVGTFHAGVSIERALPAPHVDRIAGARAVVLELDASHVQAETMQARMVLAPDEHLSQILPGDVWGALSQALPVPTGALDRLQPWVVMSMLMVQELDEGTEEGEAPARLDVQIAEAARAHEVPIVELETAEEQVELLASLPVENVVDYLRAQLFTGGDTDDQPSAQELRDMYLAGELEAIHRAILDPEEIAAAPEVFERLFFARNDRWLEALREELAEGGIVVAVGLGHLLGERGLLAALEGEGFTVERLSASSG